MTLLEQFQLWMGTSLPNWAAYLIAAVAGIVALIAFAMIMMIIFIYVERRTLGRFQLRLGPNRLGPEGIFQPFATAVKALVKEDVVPTAADKILHLLAPIVVFAPVLLIFAVIPISRGAIFADLNIGILYVVAIGSISVIGIFMAGWGSSNKYALISSLRVVAQMVSYELPIVLSLLGVILMVGSLSLNSIVAAQNIPFILLQPLGFIIFFIGTIAELNRSPFDLLEADSEIVAGYHIEYSGMKFAMFYMGEYGHAAAYSAIITTLFLSGWRGPLLPPILWFVIKMLIVFFIMIWLRATLPRFRVDQLMSFGWKGLLPMAIVNLFVVAIEVLWIPASLPWVMIIINFIVAGILILLMSKLITLGSGRVEV
jgi:NADH-quinone oxidoreductase subunit H